MKEGGWPLLPFAVRLDQKRAAVVFQFRGSGVLGLVPLPGLLLYEVYRRDDDEDVEDPVLEQLARLALADLLRRLGAPGTGAGDEPSGSAGGEEEGEKAPEKQPPEVTPFPPRPGKPSEEEEEEERKAARVALGVLLAIIIVIVVLALFWEVIAAALIALAAALVALLAALVELAPLLVPAVVQQLEEAPLVAQATLFDLAVRAQLPVG